MSVYEKRAERSERLELKYAAMGDSEIRERKQNGRPVTEAHRHLIELKCQGLALHEVADEALKLADQYGEHARICWPCGGVFHADEGYFLNKAYCSAECYRAR